MTYFLRFAGLVLTAVILSSLTTTAFAADTLFFNGFEGGSFSGWDTPVGTNFSLSGGTCRLGPDSNTAAVKVTGATTPHAQILKKTVSTAGYENLKLSFCFKWDVLEVGDALIIEYTTNGSTWQTLKTIDSSTVRHMMYAADNTEIATSNGVGEIPTPIPMTLDQLAAHAIALPAGAADKPNFALRLREQMTDGNDFIWLDDVRLTGEVIIEPPTGNNLITNGGLETAGANPALPQDWFKGGWGTNTRNLSYPVAGSEGASAAKIEITTYTSGDAKWYFKEVGVIPGTPYTFSNQYQSNVPSYLVAQYKKTDGTVSYVELATLPPSPTTFQASNLTFTPPSGVTSITIFHLIKQVGSLTTDNYNLSGEGVTPPVKTNLITNPSVETAGSNPALPQSWQTGKWGTNTATFTYPVTGLEGAKAMKIDMTTYTSGDAKWYFADVPVTAGTTYTFSEDYVSTLTTEPTVRFTLTDNTYRYERLALLVPAASPTHLTASIVPPANAVSLTIFHFIAGVGSLTTDNFSLISQ